MADLQSLRDALVEDLKNIHRDIDKELAKMKDKSLRKIFLKIIERQDKLFEYYVSSRESIVASMMPPKEEILLKKPSQQKEENAFTESMDLLLRYF